MSLRWLRPSVPLEEVKGFQLYWKQLQKLHQIPVAGTEAGPEADEGIEKAKALLASRFEDLKEKVGEEEIPLLLTQAVSAVLAVDKIGSLSDETIRNIQNHFRQADDSLAQWTDRLMRQEGYVQYVKGRVIKKRVWPLIGWGVLFLGLVAVFVSLFLYFFLDRW